LYFQEPEYARRFYTMSRYDAASFEIARRVPLLAERSAIWGKVERLRRAISQQGMPSEATNEFGRAADFTLLEARDRNDFVKHCENAMGAELNAPIKEMLREAQQRNLRVVFVLMPMPPRHVQTFYETDGWMGYQRHLRELLTEDKVTMVDASHWMPNGNSFGDPLHLTEEGAKEFSRRLAAACADAHGTGCGE
jgi:hypothetical protein